MSLRALLFILLLACVAAMDREYGHRDPLDQLLNHQLVYVPMGHAWSRKLVDYDGVGKPTKNPFQTVANLFLKFRLKTLPG